MITSIIIWLMTKGVPEKWAKRSVIAVGVLGAFLACVALKTCYDNRVISNHETEVTSKTLNEKIEADDNATVQREKDSKVNREKADARNEAIEDAVDSTPSPSAIELGCERLRQDGYRTDKFPECGGR